MNAAQIPIRSLACLCLMMSAVLAQSQTFDCGSNGSYGPMHITQSTTLSLPADGIFHCTTVNVSAGATLKFGSNALNTPVYILATGDVTIGGTIDVSGQKSLGVAGGLGGPGGYQGGSGKTLVGPGNGPGGGARGVSNGVGGSGAYRISHGIGGGDVYGNSLMIPLFGGSGGGGTSAGGGGGGGGAILIASNSRIIFSPPSSNIYGTILAQGGAIFTLSGSPHSGAGSGGAIRLVSPAVSGPGQFAVNSNVLGGALWISNGRFRIDSFDTSGFSAYLGNGGDSPDAVGSVMTVFPSQIPKLSVVAAAGTTIPENATTPVNVNLPSSSPTSQTVKVRARDFGGLVPIRVRLVPEDGNATTFDASIDNTVNNPAETTVNVTMPVGVAVNVQVYTR